MSIKNSFGHNNKEFATEACLVERFLSALQAGRTVFGAVQVTTEWDHRSGCVDVLARDGTQSLVAFEAKLADWKRAFLQAYRNTAYANRAYVLLPEKTAHRAMRNREEFEFRGVGLCAFDGEQVQILIEAFEQEALLAWLRARAHEHFDALQDERRPRPNRSRSRPVQAARI
jgi:hypothetical protein